MGSVAHYCVILQGSRVNLSLHFGVLVSPILHYQSTTNLLGMFRSDTLSQRGFGVLLEGDDMQSGRCRCVVSTLTRRTYIVQRSDRAASRLMAGTLMAIVRFVPVQS